MSLQADAAALDRAVADLAVRLRESLDPPARAGVDVTVDAVRGRIDAPLPEHGAPLEEILPELIARTEGALAGTTGPRYFGYVTGGVLPGAVVAEAWAASVDQNPGLWTLAPAAVEIDRLALRWIAELVGYPSGSGTLTSGATMSTIVGLAVGRHALGLRLGIDVAEAGVRALPPLAVYGSEEIHHSVVKALRVLGLGAACLRRVPLDAEHRMDVSALAEAIAVDERAGVVPAIAVGQAASAQTGASDPLDRVADVCERHGVWLHVDGAFGAFLRLCERTAPLVAGLERADSLAVDGHKWLNVPNGIGFALVRDAALHRQALAGSASYLTGLPGAGEDPHALGIESSRGWRGAAVWAAIRQLGRSGVGEIVTRCCDCAAHLAALVERSPRLELVAPAASCVVCFRYRPAGAPDGPALDELNRRIQVDVARGGDVFVGGAELGRGFCLRACIVSWRTHREDVEALVDAVEAAGVRLG